ncbi:hypothetical protein WISP_30368 [Willisornis vidua]|uniref:Uncharacterized protein n=1 Tax=Willisornis vidua TaxID=1566151 RepID=A0ABQ9DRK1_9PASS|nr:hypothetical protein WISP_30368 [Willisornis vidua]
MLLILRKSWGGEEGLLFPGQCAQGSLDCPSATKGGGLSGTPISRQETIKQTGEQVHDKHGNHVNKHKPWIETSYHGIITENNDTVILDPPLVALDKDAPVPFAGFHGKSNFCNVRSRIKLN